MTSSGIVQFAISAVLILGGPAAAGQISETILHKFDAESSGGYPYAGVVRDSSGNLYGSAFEGGKWQRGVVYKLDPSGHERVLHDFTGGADGAKPVAALILDSAGNLYGTATIGGTGHAGVVFKLDSAQHYSVLYSFTGGADGGHPQSSLAMDTDGNLYGTAVRGGYRDNGVVYKLDSSGKETVLHTFKNGADGAGPVAGVTLDSAGNVYGTTKYGGPSNLGTVYKIDPAGTETILHSFQKKRDGHRPALGVTLDAAGSLYGATGSGGRGNGAVYQIDAAGHEKLLYAFSGVNDGVSPSSGLTLDASGNLYGVTYAGGSTKGGTIYKVDGTGKETVLYTFPLCGQMGCRPRGNLTLSTRAAISMAQVYSAASRIWAWSSSSIRPPATLCCILFPADRTEPIRTHRSRWTPPAIYMGQPPGAANTTTESFIRSTRKGAHRFCIALAMATNLRTPPRRWRWTPTAISTASALSVAPPTRV